MKKAFTLIELLVVIAIIAILAAILFPVFAQAKSAAKKAVSISNQKQLGLALLMYANDYDDMYPRNDGCTLNDSFNPVYDNQPAGTIPTPFCSNAYPYPGGYAFRDNFYSWGKWVIPYVKSTGLFFHPVIQKSPNGWVSGELDGGYALNDSLTGRLNLSYPYTGKIGQYGNVVSWLGGVTTAVPQPAETMLIMEQTTYSIAGGYEAGTTANNLNVTSYPMAIKEHYSAYFYQQGGTGQCGEQVGVVDPTAAPFAGSVPLSYCDGHAKAIPVGSFLANTPTAAQYGVTWHSRDCYINGEYYGNSNTPPIVTSGVWPMWGL